MFEFIAKYWVEFVFGIIAAWLLSKVKHFQDLEKQQQENIRKALEEKIIKDVDEKISTLSTASTLEDKALHS